MNALAKNKYRPDKKRPAAPLSNIVEEGNSPTVVPNKQQHRARGNSPKANSNFVLLLACAVSVVSVTIIYFVSKSGNDHSRASVAETPAIAVDAEEYSEDAVIASHIMDVVIQSEPSDDVLYQTGKAKHIAAVWEASPLIEPKWEPSPLVK